MSLSVLSECYALCSAGANDAQEGTSPKSIQLLPVGPVINTIDGRSFTLESPLGLVNKLNSSGRHYAIDINHATTRKGMEGEESPAVGWMTDFFISDGHICANVEWTGKGKKILNDKEYKYISPTLQRTVGGEIIGITCASLVNHPALTMKALCSAGDGQVDSEEELMSQIATLQAQNNTYKYERLSVHRAAVNIALRENNLASSVFYEEFMSTCDSKGVDEMFSRAQSISATCGIMALRGMQTDGLNLKLNSRNRHEQDSSEKSLHEVAGKLGVVPEALAKFIKENNRG
ncbi:hypothetical protein ABT925_000219 [Salmonella enterica subsp. enterica serovar Give]